jgi:hypothetical protein
MALIQDAMSASMPGTAKQFLGSVQPKPVGQMIMYMGILGILPLVGFLLGGLIAGGAVWGLVMGIIMAIGLIGSAIGSGFVLSAISQGTLGRQITPDEGITLCGYAMTPVFVAAFLGGLTLMGGIWTFGLSMLLVSLGLLYMAFLIYQGAGVRYGADKAVVSALLVLIVSGIVASIFWWIGVSVATGMAIGAGLDPIRRIPYYYGYP